MKNKFAIVLTMSMLFANTVYAQTEQSNKANDSLEKENTFLSEDVLQNEEDISQTITENIKVATENATGKTEQEKTEKITEKTDLEITEEAEDSKEKTINSLNNDFSELVENNSLEIIYKNDEMISETNEENNVSKLFMDDFPKMLDSNDFAYFENFLTDDSYVTRGEMATMLTQIFNYEVTSVNYFNDLDDEYYKEPLLKLAAADIMVGDGNMMRPTDSISYEEVCTILYKILQVDESDDIVVNSYLNISPWATNIVNSLATGGYIDISNCNNIDATEEISYKEFKDMFSYALPIYYEKENSEVGKITTQNILITSNYVTFEDSILGDVYISNNVDMDTIKFINSTFENIIEIKDGYNTHKDESFDFVLSEFSTTFDPRDINRTTNLRISMEVLDEVTIEPKKQFSFNKTLGERTYEKGYKDATVIYVNTEGSGIAGGICQTSTTLFNVALFSGLRIDERSSHTLKVPYVEAGRDAMVNYGTNDLMFSNYYDVPVKIATEFDSTGKLTISISSQGYLEVPKVEVTVAGGSQNYITTVKEDNIDKGVFNSWYFK